MWTDPDAVEQLIASAEIFSDPLDGLADRVAADPGAPFTPEALERLDALRREDRPAFERLRAALKSAGCRVTALDNALRDMSPDGGERETQADRLVSLAADIELFHSQDETAFADVMHAGARQTWPVRSPGFRSWLVRRYYEETERVPNSEAVGAALNLIDANARFAGDRRTVFVRCGCHEERIYLDLGDETWRAIEIDAFGWRIVEAPPVRFRRARGTAPLPAPEPGGCIDRLRPFVNVAGEADFILVVAWLLAALSPFGPHPLLVLRGEQGTAKSTLSRILARLTDPRLPDLRSLPREERDLFIAARNAQVLAYDNVSVLPPWLADAFCRLSTGGGFATRKLHSDDDETLFDAMRPIILNGIEDFLSRPDLADRALSLELEVIGEVRPEREIWATFETAQPAILGALCDALAMGLRRRHAVTLGALPRMADFALWVSACETAFFAEGSFIEAYRASRSQMVDSVIEGDAVASGIRELMAYQEAWEGTATELLESLERRVDTGLRGKNWPTSPRGLSNRLKRASTFLRRSGISVSYHLANDRKRSRLIRLSACGDTEAGASSVPSAPPGNFQSEGHTDDADEAGRFVSVPQNAG